MSWFYTLAYRIGFTPWEEAVTHGPAAERIRQLLDRETAEHGSPRRRALDPAEVSARSRLMGPLWYRLRLAQSTGAAASSPPPV